MRVAGSVRGFLAALAVTSATQLAAQEREVVYRPLVTDGAEYRRVSYPEAARDIVVMAENPFVLQALEASVGYWPITREYVAETNEAEELDQLAFELVGPDGSVTEIEPEPYLIWHPDGVGAGPAELVHGDEVAMIYERYVQDARAAVEAQREYQQIVAEHQAAVEAWLRIAATRPEELPPPPPEMTTEPPTRYAAFATEPELGRILELPEGNYKVRLRAEDGTVVPGSERSLVSFAPLAEGTGYVIRPEDRWTQPAISFGPGDTIYTTGGSDIFVQPVPVAEFSAQHYTRLFRPQSVEASDPFLTLWVPRPEARSVDATMQELLLRQNGEAVATLPAQEFRVRQIPGRSRGYTIEEFAPVEGSQLAADFSAMRIPAQASATSMELIAGEPVPSSRRTIREVSPPSAGWLFLPALGPLLIGVALHRVMNLRRRKRRTNSAASAAFAASGLT